MRVFIRKVILAVITLFVLVPSVFYTIFGVDDDFSLIEVNENMALYNQCTPKEEQTDYLDRQGTLNVVVWNVYKQKFRSVFADLSHLGENNNLMLLQEVSLKPEMQHYIRMHKLNADMVSAFKMFDVPAGVMTLSRIQASETCDFLAKEPWLRLPKSALVSHFSLSNGEKLIVINLHSINFSWRLTSFNAQLDTLVDELVHHKGPIIVGGDFNTWRGARLEKVKALARQLALREVRYEPDKRKKFFGHHLDHLYYRGLEFISGKSLQVDSSDHNPIEASFKII